MSYLFDGTNDVMTFDSSGTGFASPSGAGVPIVVSFWAKAATVNAAASVSVVQWGTATTAISGARAVQRITNNPDNWAASVGSSGTVVSTANVTTDWVNVIGYWASNTERYIWTNHQGVGGGSGLSSASIATSWDTLLIGKSGDAAEYWGGKIAHLVICENYVLTATDREYLSGYQSDGTPVTAYRPDHANLSALYAKAVAYYPFTADATDAKNSYDLTVDGATLDGADNPSLSSGASAVKGRNLLLGVG